MAVSQKTKKKNGPAENDLNKDQKIFKYYTDKALDLSRRNRLLKYPDKGARLEFDLSFEECAEYLGSPSEICVEFPHKKILDEESRREKRKARGEPEFDPKDEEITRTLLRGEKLLNQISRLQRLSAKTFKEHGLNTLFLAVGEINWKIVPRGRGSADAVKEQVYIAPVMLIPVSLITPRTQPKTSTLDVDLTLYPIQINPVLITWMQQNQLAVPSIPESIAEGYDYLPKLLKQLKTSFDEAMIKATVSERVYVGQFTYHGQQIYEDLKRYESQMLSHDFISCICGGNSLPQDDSAGAIDDAEEPVSPDDFFTAEDDYTIHDSDSSQTEAIRAVLSGKHMVIHGPPGTGKSQTIANIIANLLAREKKVLFVCEKQAALDVVYRQKMTFDTVNLADLCLPLYEYRGSRATFARDLLNSRDRVARNLNQYGNREYDDVLEKRSKRLNIIKEYSQVLIEPLPSLERSPYWVFGELACLSDRAKEMRVAWSGKAVDDIEYAELEDNKAVIADLNPYKELIGSDADYKWAQVNRKHSTTGVGRSILVALKELRQHVKQIARVAGTRLEPKAIDDAEKIIELITDQTKHVILDNGTYSLQPFADSDATKAVALLGRASAAAEGYRKIVATKPIKGAGEWKTPTVEKATDAIALSASLEQLYTPAISAALDEMVRLLKTIPGKLPKQLSNITLQQYRQNSGFYRMEKSRIPMMSMSRDALSAAQKTLKTLATLASQVEKTDEVLTKYGVHISDLNDEDANGIEQRFATGYKTFFRVFSSTYKLDRLKIEQWCVSSKPNGFRSLKEVAESAAARLRSKRRYDEESKSLATQCSLDSSGNVSVSQIEATVSMIAAYLELNATDKLDAGVLEIAQSEECRDLSGQIATISEQLLPQWSVLQEFAAKDINAMKLSEATRFLDSFGSAYKKVRVAYDTAKKHLDTNPVRYTLGELMTDIQVLDEASQHLHELEDSGIPAMIGISADGILSDVNVLSTIQTHIESLGTIRSFFSGRCTLRQIYSYCEAISENLSAVQKWHRDFDVMAKNIGTLYENENVVEYYKSFSFSAVDALLADLESDSAGLEEWMRFQHHKHVAGEHGLAWFVDLLTNTQLDTTPLEDIYLASFYTEWFEKACEAYPILQGFDVEKHEKILKEFRELDKQSLKANRMRILTTLRAGIAHSKNTGMAAERVLRREAEKTRQHKPIRQLVEDYADHIQEMKPCWMVSPLTVGSYLKYGSVEFDVVIFDEASQMTVENALGAIARAKQVVVIGDEHQLPPTPFFNFSSADDDEQEDEDVVASTGYESILKSAISILGGSKTWLKYHYRSKSEDLIAFSNHYIYSHYNQPLVTFPSATPGKRGIQFVHVNGVYKYSEDRNTNLVEAQKIADLCIQHAKTTPEKSLGIIAFSVAQEEEIRDTLQNKLKDHPELQTILDEESDDAQNAFFITNLESVQGDERDVIMLSICYGKDPKGTFAQRFGPLNSAYGYRRLNVAITRARESLICVASIHAHDIKIAESTGRGVQLLQKYLEYAKDGIETLSASKTLQTDPTAEADSEFEIAVRVALEKRGHTVQPQVGASGYKIDLAIVDPKTKNHYILGIECDGAAYHSSHSARERDRIRQDVLEAYGWKLYRIWSQHWFEHRDDVLDDIDHYIKRLAETRV